MLSTAPFRPSFNPVPKQITRYGDQKRKRLAEAEEIKAVYKDVDQRDGRIRCRCCGRKSADHGGHTHNHLRPRSLAPKVIKHTRKNIHGCCNTCNLLLKNYKIRVIGTDCDKPLAFKWTTLATERERHGIVLRDERAPKEIV